MTLTWDSQNMAMGMRDVIAAIAENRINALRPETSYAVVETINREARSATVRFMGDDDPVTVAMGSIEPATVGQTVRIGGTIGHRFIDDVLGNALMSGNDVRYAQVGHTHAGGGAVELEMNDLADVDTETNPPGPETVLGWNDVGGYWEPISIDLGTEFLPLTGGEVTGPVTFGAAVTMNSTLGVIGALTAASYTGVGTNLSNLNATALTTGTVPTARLPSLIGSNTTGTAAAWTTGRLLTVGGDMSGTVTIKGDADMNLNVALQPNSIDLGADTTGNYVAHIIGTANQVISDNVVAGEGITHTLSLPQSIHSAATPSFARLSLTQATGTAPMTITSQTLVSNLNVELLGGSTKAFYQDAGNLITGTLLSARLTGNYAGVTGLGALTTLTVTGVAALGNNSTVAGTIIWHAGNDGAGSALDAGLLGGVLPAGYASMEIMESLMGDLLAVGLYDAASYNGDLFSLVFNRSTQNQITGLTIATGDHPFEAAFAFDLPIIPQADILAGEQHRYLIRNGVSLDVTRNGDDDHLLRSTGYVSTPDDDTFVVSQPVVIRARVRKTTLNLAGIRQIARHGSTTTNEAWTLYMDTGKLVLRVSNNGTTMTTVDVLTFAELDTISGTANNTDFYVAVSISFTGTNLSVRGWGSVNGDTWTTAGPVRTVAYSFMQFFDTTSSLYIGGETTGQNWDGRVYWVDMIQVVDPNTANPPIWRFDGRDHPYGGGLSYVDPYNRTWTLSTAGAITDATYVLQAFLVTSGGTRSVLSTAFAYWPNVTRPWHGRVTWTPATDTLAVAWRSGEGVALDAATPAWTTNSAVFATETMSTIGAVVIGQQVSGPSNWSYGGRMSRIRIVKNAVTLLDLRNTNITVAGQTVITPTTGPAMTLSSNTMAITTMPKPVWAEGPTVYRHNMYWIVASVGEVDFVDSDLSGRYELDVDDAVIVSNGDWIIAIDPLFGAPGHEEGTDLTLAQMVFQYIPFSTETFVKNQIQEHALDILDPHAAAGYLKATAAAGLYAPLIHTHEAEISNYITIHEGKFDPHPQYLTVTEANGLYVTPDDQLPYEPQGAVLAHEQKADPHPQYTSHAEANALYADINHLHTGIYAQEGHTHAGQFEVLATDGAQSARIFIGDDAPVNPLVGDLWIQTFDISLQPPAPPLLLTVSATGPTTITLLWGAYDASVGITSIQIERSPDGVASWTNIFTDSAAPFVTTFQDTGRAERTTYWYRVRGVNSIGNGIWAVISGATTNAPPAAPALSSPSNQTSANIRLNWVAVSSPANDPLHATQPYEVFRNGVFIASTTSLFYDFGGLAENTSYNLGVRSKDNTGLTSTLSVLAASTLNDTPPTPTGLSVTGITYNQATLNWSAVTGITDFSRYQVFLNGGYVADTTSLSYTFGSLAASTGYSFGVRSVDTGSAVSSIATTPGTTPAAPDTTPPPAVAVTLYQPLNNYGEMYIQWNSSEATANTIVYRNINGAGWEQMRTGPLAAGTGHLTYLGTFDAGTTIYSVIHQWDAAGNVTYGTQYAYTLKPSPAQFGAHGSNSWRGTNGGEWNAAGGYRVIQGYYDNPALNAIGYFFHGYDFGNWYVAGTTITWAQIFLYREGCGINQQDDVSLWAHQGTDAPGTGAGDVIDIYDGPHQGGTLAYGEAKWCHFPVGWAYNLCNGSRRGIAIADITDGKPYMCIHPAGVGYCGAVEFYHWG